MKFYLLLISLFLINACSTMDAEKCTNTDWETKGNSDAKNSRKNYYDTYRAECAEFGITPDKTKYETGFQAGVTDLCTFQNGYLIGNQGNDLPQICPVNLQEKFVQGYIQGKTSYDNKEQLNKQNQLIEKAIDSKSSNNSRCFSNQDCSTGGVCHNNACYYK